MKILASSNFYSVNHEIMNIKSVESVFEIFISSVPDVSVSGVDTSLPVIYHRGDHWSADVTDNYIQCPIGYDVESRNQSAYGVTNVGLRVSYYVDQVIKLFQSGRHQSRTQEFPGSILTGSNFFAEFILLYCAHLKLCMITKKLDSTQKLYHSLID